MPEYNTKIEGNYDSPSVPLLAKLSALICMNNVHAQVQQDDEEVRFLFFPRIVAPGVETLATLSYEFYISTDEIAQLSVEELNMRCNREIKEIVERAEQ